MTDQIVPSEQTTNQPNLPQQQAQSVLPTTPIMAKQTYASPMSYIGITRRTTAWIRKVGAAGPAQAAAAWFGGASFLIMMYCFLMFWYFWTFVIFGAFAFPYRWIRRGQRKQQAVQSQQLATMQAMMLQQQQMLNQNQQQH